MYRKILLSVAIDEWSQLSTYAQTAAEVATALAKGADAELHLLTVYDYPELGAEDLTLETDESGGRKPALSLQIEEHEFEQDPDEIDAAVNRQLEQLAGRVRGQGVQVRTHKVLGDPHQEVVRMANQIGVDAIVIGAHNKRNLLDFGLGSTANTIARVATCPVLMVTPHGADEQPE